MKAIHLVVYVMSLFIPGCTQLSDSTGRKAYTSYTDDRIACSPTNSILDSKDNQPGHTKASGVQHDLHIIADGFQITPLTGLGTWTMFTPNLDTAMVTGDIVIKQENFARVQQEIIAKGLTVTDIHKYQSRDRSVIFFMHIKGFGNQPTLSRNVDALITALRAAGKNYKNREVKAVPSKINTGQLDSIMGYVGRSEGEIYKHSIARINLSKPKRPGKDDLEFKTWAAWQGTDEEAFVSGDFTMIKSEVEPVLKALAENGFELIHNQLVHVNPDVFLLHYWGVGNAGKLAKGLRAALGQ